MIGDLCLFHTAADRYNYNAPDSCYLPTTLHKTPTKGIHAPSRIFAGCELILLGELVRELTKDGWAIPIALEHDGIVIVVVTDKPNRLRLHADTHRWRCEEVAYELFGHNPGLKYEILAEPTLEE